MTLTLRPKTLLIFQISAPKTQWVEESRSGSLRPGRRTLRRWTPSSPAPSATTRSPARFPSIYSNCHELNNFTRWKWTRVNMLPRSSVLFAWRIFRSVCHTYFYLRIYHSTPDSRSPQNRQQSTSCQSQWTSTMNGSTLVRPSITDHSNCSLKISNLWSFVCDFWYSLATTLL